jgi:Predicted glycosyltransferases
MKISLVVPTKNGGEIWKDCVKAILEQSITLEKVLIIDSMSSDDTNQISGSAGFDVILIDPSLFNHGGTRNLAMKYLQNTDFVVFLTQDAILASKNAITQILVPFSDESVAAVYGRQIPHTNANPIARHARLFNYPEQSSVKSDKDIPSLGIKTAFFSNSFSAYRTSVFFDLLGFPEQTILAEDMFLAAKTLKSGYKIAYCAEAVAYHSHNYSPWDEFRRYFDIGVFHASEPWIRLQFGETSGEGKKFVISELRYLLTYAPLWIPISIITNICKLLGYHFGVKYKILPKRLIIIFSMHKKFWCKR